MSYEDLPLIDTDEMHATRRQLGGAFLRILG